MGTATFSMVQSDGTTAFWDHYITILTPNCKRAWYVLPREILLIYHDNVYLYSPLLESHGKWRLSRTIISVTSLLTVLSTPWVLLWERDAYIAPHSFIIMKVQCLSQEGRACRWHHAAPWTAVRMSQVNVGRLKVTVVPYVREQNPPVVREFPVRSMSKYRKLIWQEDITDSDFYIYKNNRR